MRKPVYSYTDTLRRMYKTTAVQPPGQPVSPVYGAEQSANPTTELPQAGLITDPVKMLFDAQNRLLDHQFDRVRELNEQGIAAQTHADSLAVQAVQDANPIAPDPIRQQQPEPMQQPAGSYQDPMNQGQQQMEFGPTAMFVNPLGPKGM